MPPQITQVRAALLKAVSDWEAGRLGPWDLVDYAESLAEELPESLWTHRSDNAQEIVLLALEMLEYAHHQAVLPEDAPVIREFLESPAGSEAHALAVFRRHWDSIDYDAREVPVQEYWWEGRS